MGRVIAGFTILIVVLAMLNMTYVGRIIIRYALILLIVSLLIASGSQVAYLLGAVGDATAMKKAAIPQTLAAPTV